MKRLFNEHIIRSCYDLNGNWLFQIDADDIGEKQGWQNGLPQGESVIVPSNWNNELGLLNYEGCAWYQKGFTTDGGTLRFEFGSVMTKADVWLDGKWIGEHYGAFTPFEFIVNDVKSGEHTLTVRADSTINKNSFPQRYTDWFNYGGIARDVEFNELKGICVLSNPLKYTLSDDFKKATVNSSLELFNASASESTSYVSVKIGDTVIYKDKITLNGYERKALTTPDFLLDEIKLWDVGTPNLYTVTASTDTDDLIDKIGFRKIEVKDGDILLNGKAIELLGINRHEEHPEWGFAFPPRLMKKDIDLILNMNCNTIRGSHYPNSKIFLDMLDEKGLLFWSEIPMWGCGFQEDALTNPTVVERGLKMHREMTKYYYNHPSIIIWGLHNEAWNALDCTYEMTKKYYEHLKEYGGNRLITHAAYVSYDDKSLIFDDIICINAYYGWYGESNGSFDEWNKFVIEFKEHLNKQGFGDKPLIMSEFGAGALAGFHSHFDTVRWSEEYQRDLLEYAIELFHNTDYIKGYYIWQFCNTRTSPSMDINRVRYFNNKGILDEYRNPKAAYFKVKELYGKYAKGE